MEAPAFRRGFIRGLKNFGFSHGGNRRRVELEARMRGAVGVLAGKTDESSSHRVLMDVLAMALVIFGVADSMIGEAFLPKPTD